MSGEVTRTPGLMQSSFPLKDLNPIESPCMRKLILFASILRRLEAQTPTCISRIALFLKIEAVT